MVQPSQGLGGPASHEALLPITNPKGQEAGSSQATQSPPQPTEPLAPPPVRGSEHFLKTLARKPPFTQEKEKPKEPTLCDRLDSAMTEAAATDNPEPILQVLNNFDTKSVTGMGQQKFAVTPANEPAVDKKVREALIQAKEIFRPYEGCYRDRLGLRSFLPLRDLLRHIQTYLKNCKEPENEDSVQLKEFADIKKRNLPSTAAMAFSHGYIPEEKQEAIFNEFEPVWEAAVLTSPNSYYKTRALIPLIPEFATEEDQGSREKIGPKLLDRCLELCCKLAKSIDGTDFNPDVLMKTIKQAYKGKETDKAYLARLSEISSHFFPNNEWEANTHVQRLLSHRPVIAKMPPVYGSSEASYKTFANIQELMAHLLSPANFQDWNIGKEKTLLRERGWTDKNCAEMISKKPSLEWKYNETDSEAAQKTRVE